MKARYTTCLVVVAVAGLACTHRECDAFSPAPITSARIRPRQLDSSSLYSHNDEAGEATSSKSFVNVGASSELQKSLKTFLTSAALAATVLTSPISIQMQNDANNNLLLPTISITQSQALALTENQQFVADVWFAVSAQYFDQSFNGLGDTGWRTKEKEAIAAVADTGPEDDDIVSEAIKQMLSALDDPYTRFLPREKYDTLTAYATNRNTAGIGVQLLEDPISKNVMVMATTPNGPASKAGIQSGDIIVKVNGEGMEGMSADVVAAKCRGDVGEKLDLDYVRSEDDGKTKQQHVSVTRATITQKSIEATTYVSTGGKKIGLLRVPSFSTETVSQIVNELRSVQNDKVDAIAIDLRGNVGGYMPAGVDLANLFLPSRAHIIAEVGKSGTFKAYDADGIGSETSLPVYILVDKRTASAAEIFTAALQDNRRALVVGKTNTFGKGRIQNVQPLENGSGVAVTRARYVTPNGKDIHGVGIVPNREPSQCEANDSAKTCLADIVDS